MDIKKEVEKRGNYIIRLRKHFHKHPELSLKEFETSKRIREELTAMEIPYVIAGETGVIGFVGHGDRVIALRADMDALPIVEKTCVDYKSVNEGVMHACGHDAHVAALLGAADILKTYEDQLTCTIKLIFQPSEENCMGAKLLTEQGFVDDVEEIYGLHVFADIPCGKISIQSGARMAASDIFHITLHGHSGHAGKPQQCVDATLAAAATVVNLQSIISRELDPNKSAVVTVGSIHSGSAHNIISGEAKIDGTVRTFELEDCKLIESSLKRIVQNTAETYHATATIDYQRSLHPVVFNDEEVTKKAMEEARKVFPEKMFVDIPRLFLGEDFSTYQQTIPGTFAFVGAGNEQIDRAFPNHHNKFNIDEKAVLHATALYVAFGLAGGKTE
ncbi:MAG: amidohydrolase [bacterium]|nr:amidohydrolase [bacterium]